MPKLQSNNGSCATYKRTRTRKTLSVLALSIATLLASAVSFAAKPAPALNATVCTGIGGAWTSNTCTIAEGTSGVASSGFRISNAFRLDVRGSLTINAGVTVTNSGTITVANAGGILPPLFDDFLTGLLIYGTLDNSGAITVANVYDLVSDSGTSGINISITVTASNPDDASTYVVTPGVLNNSGTITLQNGEQQTRGIENLGTLANSASGTIIAANAGTGSVGIYNKRAGGSEFIVKGTLANAGNVIIANSGSTNGGTQYGYGIYNTGQMTTNGTFAIDPSPAFDDARGFYNSGTFTNDGTFTNSRGLVLDPDPPIWGSYNNSGTMINYGTTTSTGTFFTNLIMINYGTVTTSGTMYDASGLMINYGKIYNAGTIVEGNNKGICIDQISINPDATGCR